MQHLDYLFLMALTGIVLLTVGALTAMLALLQGRSRERQQVEARLQAAKEAAEAGSRVKSELLATVGHELRAPINDVIGMTSLLLDTALTSEQRNYVETVRNSADALLSVINDMLDFPTTETGADDDTAKPVTPKELRVARARRRAEAPRLEREAA